MRFAQPQDYANDKLVPEIAQALRENFGITDEAEHQARCIPINFRDAALKGLRAKGTTQHPDVGTVSVVSPGPGVVAVTIKGMVLMLHNKW